MQQPDFVVVHIRVDRAYAKVMDVVGQMIGARHRSEVFEVGFLSLADRLGVKDIPRRLPTPPAPPPNRLENYEKYFNPQR